MVKTSQSAADDYICCTFTAIYGLWLNCTAICIGGRRQWSGSPRSDDRSDERETGNLKKFSLSSFSGT